MSCPSCGAVLDTDARFCSSCGHAVTVRSDERRIATIVFGDLVGFTSLSESLDPEAVKGLLDTTMNRLAADVVGFGGRVDKILGDGLLALFGTPVTNEDDAERAVRAALAMQSSVAAIATETGYPIQMRIGVNTGEVVVGDISGDGSTTALGDVVNTASRLQEEAVPGSVLVGPATFEATAEVFDYGEAVSLRPRGREEAIDVRVPLRALGLPGQRSRATLPLIGRDIELDVLQTSIDAAFKRDRAQMTIVLGEAGVGKTRLADEIQRYVEVEHEAFVFSGRCVPYGEANVWFPVADAVRSRLGVSNDASQEEVVRRIEAVVSRREAEPDDDDGRMLDAIMYLLGYDSALNDVDPVRAQDETGRAIRLIIENQAQDRPVLLRLTDLHWADDVILDLLDGLMRRLSRLPVVVVATARHALTDRWVPRPDRHNTLTTTLDALDDSAAGELLDAVLPDMVDDEQRKALLDRAGGNPLFLEELAALVRSGDGAVDGDLPSNLQGLVGARLDRLTEIERMMLDDAAVLGRDGSFDALERMNQEMRGGATIETPLRSLVAHDLLERPTDTTWRFRSDLVRDVVYGRLTKTDRAYRHYGVATYVETAFGAKADLATVAYHYRRAAALSAELGGVDGIGPEVREKALQLTRDAARLAVAQAANGSAVILLTEAIEIAGPEHPDRVEIALDRAKANIEVRRLDDARRDIDDALSLADPGERPDLVSAATLRLGEVEQWSGEYELAESLISDALAGFTELGDAKKQGDALRSLGQTMLLSAKLTEAEPVLVQALETALSSGDRRSEAWARQNLAWLSFANGQAEAAEERLAEADSLFAKLGDSAGREWSQGLLAFVRMHQGRFEEARVMATVGLEDARTRGDKWAEGMMGVLLASTHLWTGRTEESVPVARDALRLFSSINDVGGTSQAVAVLGRSMIRSGLVAEGLRMLRGHAAEIGDPVGDRLTDLAIGASASAATSVGDLRMAESMLDVDLDVMDGSVIGASERLVSVGIARLQMGDPVGSCDALRGALDLDADDDNPNILSALTLALSATGASADQVAATAARATESPRATYLDRTVAATGVGLAAARDNDIGAVDAAFGEVHRLLGPTSDLLAKAIAALAEALALAAVGSPRAVAASTEAERQLDRLGIDAEGWRTAFELAILGT